MAEINQNENLNAAEGTSQDGPTSESTPLLGNENPGSSQTNPLPSSHAADEVIAEQMTAHFKRLRRLTTLSVVTAVMASAFCLSATIFYNVTQLPYYWWSGLSSLAWLFFLGPFTFVVSFFNWTRLSRNNHEPPRTLNSILDFVILVTGASIGFVFFADIGYDRCYRYGTPCRAHEIVFKILGGLASATAILIAFLHLSLLVHRWSTPRGYREPSRPWNFPNGQFKVEFSIKFLRQPEGTGEQSA